MSVTLDIHLRQEQERVFFDDARFRVVVMHRRCGKSVLCVIEMIVRALRAGKDFYGLYISPQVKMSKANVWSYFLEYCAQIPGIDFNTSELKITFPSGAVVQLAGGDAGNYNSLRGRRISFAVVDEAQHVPTEAWEEVLRPALADQRGGAIITGTSHGKQNFLYSALQYAQSGDDPEWSSHLIPASKSTAIEADELAAIKRSLPEAAYRAEFECDFSVALRGAYFSQEVQDLEAAGRLTEVNYDSELPVYAACDLGHSDAFVVQFIQSLGTEHRLIQTKAYIKTPIPDICHDWQTLPYPIREVVLPHDAVVTSLTDGKTRQRTFMDLGFSTQVVPRVSNIHDGIEALRRLLPHLWVSRDNASITLEALGSYRAEYDAVRRVSSVKPVHDWTSDYVDALRTYAQARPTLMQPNWGPLPNAALPASRRLRA